MAENEITAEEEGKSWPRARRRFRRWLLVLVMMIVAALVWLNGPGLRWLAPKAAAYFLKDSGVHAEFRLEGSLTAGLSVLDLNVESRRTLAELTADRVSVSYRLGKVIRGQIDRIEIDGLHADLALGLQEKDEPEEEEPEEEKQPLDLNELVKTLRSAREMVIPVTVDINDLSLNVTRDGKPFISLAKSGIHHQAGAAALNLEIGTITDATGKEWPARESSIVWNEDDLSIDRLNPFPGVGIRNLVLRLPESGEASAETEILLDDAVFHLNTSPGFSKVGMALREGRLESGKLLGHFDMEIPASLSLTSLSLNVENLLPDAKAATGSIQLLVEDVIYQQWSVPELSFDADLRADRSSVAARGVALGTEFSVNAEAPLAREGGAFDLGDLRGHLNVAEVSKLVAGLAAHVAAIDPEAPVPQSMVDGDFEVAFSDNKPTSADADIVVKPANPELASSLSLKGGWQTDGAVSAKVEIEGLTARADYQLNDSTYKAGVDFNDFRSARIDPWLAVVKADTQGAAGLTGSWEGSGNVADKRHRGLLRLDGVNVEREGIPPLAASGEIKYDWPSMVVTRGLQVEAEDQKVALDLKLSEGFVEMSNLLWQDGELAVAEGSAKLPVPEDFAKWKEMLAEDERPVALNIESKVLPLDLLKTWVPEAGKLDPRSTGHLKLNVSGDYAKPALDVLVELRDLRSPEQPDLPPADLTLNVKALDGLLTVVGEATAPDFAPALLKASMAFRPAEWAEAPELVKEEAINARVDLPRIDISRFSSLVPAVRKLAGIVTGYVEVAGVVSNPAIKGRIDLTGAEVDVKSEAVPDISEVSVGVDLALDRITLKELKATVGGGSLTCGGFLELESGKPRALDFRVSGKHLPLMRNESVIVRANTDLNLSGPWETAALTGTVGVVDSLFFKDIELLPIGTSVGGPAASALPRIDSAASPTAAVPAPFGDWRLDVLVKTQNPFLIRGNVATGQVDVNVKVGGTVETPAPDGIVKISDFRAALPFTTLSIKSGTVRFRPALGLDPEIEIRGRAEPRPYRVNVFVYGRASDPQLVLTSNPPLPDNEIMTLLATGTTTSGLEDPQAASSRAMQLLAEELRRGRIPLGKKLRPVLGLLDRVDFSVAEKDPYSSQSFSTATLSVTDNWFVSAGMGEEGDSRVLGIWRFSFK